MTNSYSISLRETHTVTPKTICTLKGIILYLITHTHIVPNHKTFVNLRKKLIKIFLIFHTPYESSGSILSSEDTRALYVSTLILFYLGNFWLQGLMEGQKTQNC